MAEPTAQWVAALAAGLVVCKWAAQQALEFLNRKEVAAQAGAVPEAFREFITPERYARAVDYTFAKGRFHQVELSWNAIVLLLVLFSGVLPRAIAATADLMGTGAWSMAACLFVIGVALSIPGLPLDWYYQFRLEARFGFNTTTQKTWWLDRAKGLALGIILGYPLLVLVLKLVEWTGASWWLWAWGALIAFQLLMSVLAPVIILPLFNKFTPLPEGTLKERLHRLAEATRFKARSIQVMDGSKRSRHSNAFFTGFGAFRKIVLFDTLIQQLTEAELEAVLAHEVGHYKRKHLLKGLLLTAAASLGAFYLINLLSSQPWFYHAFGFETGSIVPALLLFSLLSGTISFWVSPLANWWSRKHEYEADAFAAQVTGGSTALVGALRKLNEKNLSNLTPHPLYSAMYYSHPTQLERERALG
jgi:STE24 endopeptidase